MHFSNEKRLHISKKEKGDQLVMFGSPSKVQLFTSVYLFIMDIIL